MMTQYSEMLGLVNIKDVQLGNAVHKDYFYIPVFKHMEYDKDYQNITSIFEVEIRNGVFDHRSYTDKVNAGETLWHAIKNNLLKEFDYTINNWQTDWFKISSIKPFDSIDNKDEQPLDRFLVYILIAKKFDTTKVKTLGLNCRWNSL